MRNQYASSRFANSSNWPLSRKTAVGAILIVALIAFEIFNFDTTQYALNNLLGDVRFLGLQWASILAIAFCSIDFAGLIRLFTPQRGFDEPKEVWYLMGAWLLGATMNAVMTWWAISLTLLNHDFGNEVLSREQLLLYVPIFVAILVWLTRILFIGAFTVAGEHIFEFGSEEDSSPTPVRKRTSTPQRKSNTVRRNVRPAVARTAAPRPNTTQTMMRAAPKSNSAPVEPFEYVDDPDTPVYESDPVRQQPSGPSGGSRVRQRPPRPGMNNGGGRRVVPAAMRAKSSNERH